MTRPAPTERARLVLLLAGQEARGGAFPAITPLHLLAGILREEEGVAAELLTNHGVRLETVREAIGEPAERVVSPPGEMPLSPIAQRSLERGEQEAHWLGLDHMGTEHLLIGLLHEAGGEAIRLLLDAGLDERRLHDELVRRSRRRR